MPVEQGLPWHPVATGLAGQAIPLIVAASHAHDLPSAPFWFSVPAVLVASPALLCPSSLFAVLALVPPGVAPAFCVSVLLLPLSVGAPGCPCRAPPPVPPACPPRTRVSHLRTTWTVPCAVGWSQPCCHPRGGHLPERGAQFPPLWSTWAPCRGTPPPCGAEFLEVPKNLFGHIEKPPPTNNRHTELQNGSSKPFSTIRKGKKAIAPLCEQRRHNWSTWTHRQQQKQRTNKGTTQATTVTNCAKGAEEK